MFDCDICPHELRTESWYFRHHSSLRLTADREEKASIVTTGGAPEEDACVTPWVGAVPDFDVYQEKRYDHLHQWQKGIVEFGIGVVETVLDGIRKKKNQPRARQLVDIRLKSMSRYPRIAHFNGGIKTFQTCSASQLEDLLSQLWVGCLAIVPPALQRAIRSLALLSKEIQTAIFLESELENFGKQVRSWLKDIQVLIREWDLEISMKRPKLHDTAFHLEETVRSLGNLVYGSTQAQEAAHINSVKHAWRLTQKRRETVARDISAASSNLELLRRTTAVESRLARHKGQALGEPLNQCPPEWLSSDIENAPEVSRPIIRQFPAALKRYLDLSEKPKKVELDKWWRSVRIPTAGMDTYVAPCDAHFENKKYHEEIQGKEFYSTVKIETGEENCFAQVLGIFQFKQPNSEMREDFVSDFLCWKDNPIQRSSKRLKKDHPYSQNELDAEKIDAYKSIANVPLAAVRFFKTISNHRLVSRELRHLSDKVLGSSECTFEDEIDVQNNLFQGCKALDFRILEQEVHLIPPCLISGPVQMIPIKNIDNSIEGSVYLVNDTLPERI